MIALKEKVSNQLSRLFADSPKSPSSDSLASRPSRNSQGRTGTEGEKLYSSYFSFVAPTLGFGRSNSKNGKEQRIELAPAPSLPLRWRGREFHQEEELRYHECENQVRQKAGAGAKVSTEAFDNNKTDISPDDDDVDCYSQTSTSDSDVFEEASEKQTTRIPFLKDESTFISSDLYEFLMSSLPNSVKGNEWVLLYRTSSVHCLCLVLFLKDSTLKHGISLRTLIRKSADLSGPCLLIAGDRQGAIFGGLVDCPLRATSKRKYQGTNQSFVFTTIYGAPRLFRPTGANRYYYLCLEDLLALGGGGNFALRLDEDLLHGTSGPCETFGNLCLAHNSEFELRHVELWGFTYSSKY
ncbi:Oxidation resistance protein 1 [Linum grandiflorum]